MQFSGKLVIIAAIAVTVLLVSNIIATKPVSLFTLPFDFIGSNLFVVSAAIVCFPIGYIISDILTEVYGFRVARGVIWLGVRMQPADGAPVLGRGYDPGRRVLGL